MSCRGRCASACLFADLYLRSVAVIVISVKQFGLRAARPTLRFAQGTVVASLVTHRSTASACLDGPDHRHRLCERTMRRPASDLDRRSRRRETAEQYQRTAVPRLAIGQRQAIPASERVHSQVSHRAVPGGH